MTELEEKRLLTTPAGFIYRVLLQGKKKLARWQVDFVNAFRDPRRTTRASIVTPNGSGKSSILVAGLGLWLISMFPKGKFVICSFDSKQLDHQCWPSITAHRSKFENERGWRFIEREVHTPDGGFIIGFTTDDPGRAEGWHKIDDIEGPLIMMFDESKSIADTVFDAGNRCTYNGMGYVSSPGLNQGRFYESQTTLRQSADNPHGFIAMQAGLVDCPWIPQDRIDATIAHYGIDHPFTQSTLFGKFMDADADTMFVVPKSVMKQAMEAQPPYVHGSKACFCDFAAGRNENVAFFKEGNRYEMVCWRDVNTMSAVGRFLIEFKKRGLQPSETYGDRGGMGKVFIDRFHELDWPMIPVGNDDPPINPAYPNRGAEINHEASRKLAAQTEIIPNDPILFKQATSRRMDFKGGLLGIETKEEMAKRGIESPDRWDALSGVMNVDTALASSLFDDTSLRLMESGARASASEFGSLTLQGAFNQDVSFELGAPKSWLRVWERPTPGRAYLCVVNPVWHDDPFGHHTVIVLRAGWTDQTQHGHTQKNEIYPARLVAKVKKPCRMDAGPLAQTVLALTRWYGNCFTIPIANERGDVIDSLLTAGVPIYAREDFEHIRHGSRLKQTTEFGWESNEYNRSLWIGALAEAIRERRVEVGDLEAVTEMFQVTPATAKSKRDAEAIGVGMKEIQRATMYLKAPAGIFTAPRQRDLSKAMFS
jgi:hypothetical protein